MKRAYRYPLRKRDDIVRFLAQHRGYRGRGFQLAWPRGGSEDESNGSFAFSTDGRSGTYLLLDDWPGPTPNRGLGKPMIWRDHSDFVDWLDKITFEDLRALYRVVVALDTELMRDVH